MNKVWLVLFLVAIVGVGGYFLLGGPSIYKTPGQTALTSNEKTFNLSEQNKSGEYGTVVLSEKDGKVTVTLSLLNAPSGVSQPAHIHTGSCPNVGAVVYPLSNVVDGKSVTTLEATMADLVGKLPLGVNVHKSATESKVYVSCGDLTLATEAPSTTSSNQPKMTY